MTTKIKERGILMHEAPPPPDCKRPWRWKGGVVAARKRYRKKNAAKIKQITRAYHEKNREQIAARMRAYRERTKEDRRPKDAAYQRNARKRLRAEMLAALGGACACCGESEPLFLDMDHINGDGAEHRRRVGTSLSLLYAVRREGWDETKYQLLCCNCNQGRERNGGVCPHNNK